MTRKTRRAILKTLLAAPSALLLGSGKSSADGAALSLTPACVGEAAETLQQTEGPYYEPSAPLRDILGAPSEGQSAFTVCGFVTDTRCRPVAGAIVEIWHADHEGNYDNRGFSWRGHQLTDEAGRWGFYTIATHHYAFRTAHYHFHVQAPGRPRLTTQLYFPDHPRNAGDPIFDQRLVMAIDPNAAIGRFDFVVAT